MKNHLPKIVVLVALTVGGILLYPVEPPFSPSPSAGRAAGDDLDPYLPAAGEPGESLAFEIESPNSASQVLSLGDLDPGAGSGTPAGAGDGSMNFLLDPVEGSEDGTPGIGGTPLLDPRRPWRLGPVTGGPAVTGIPGTAARRGMRPSSAAAGTDPTGANPVGGGSGALPVTLPGTLPDLPGDLPLLMDLPQPGPGQGDSDDIGAPPSVIAAAQAAGPPGSSDGADPNPATATAPGAQAAQPAQPAANEVASSSSSTVAEPAVTLLLLVGVAGLLLAARRTV